MKGKRMIAWLLSTVMLAGMLPVTSFAEGTLPYANHQEDAADRGFTENDLCPHERGIHTSETSGNENTSKATDSDAVELLMDTEPYEITGEGYTFDEDAGELSISNNDGTTAWKNNSKITIASIKTVVLNRGVTAIGEDAFSGCKNLQTLDFSGCDGLEKIGISAFEGCESLLLDELPNQITTIEPLAFKDCMNLALNTLPENLTTIGNTAFYNCKNLALTSLPNGLTSIPSFAFAGCEKLALTSLPDNVDKIGNSAFIGCINLKLDSLPSSLTKINEYAFHGCSKLNLTKLPDQVDSIGRLAFYECSALALDALPGSITSIGNGAFGKCTGITSLTLSNPAAPKLGERVFSGIADLIIYVPYNATGYDGKNWPTDRVVYGAALSDLTMSDGTLTPGFFPGINDYTVSVANHVERVSVIPTAHDTETITVNDISVNSGAASGDVELEAGKITEITVTAKNSDADSRTYTIHVMRTAPDMIPVTGVTLDPAVLTLYTNKSPGAAPLTANIQPENATIQAVTWSSSAPDIAQVDNSGTVTAVSPGTATITVTTAEGGKTAACFVTVKEKTAASIPVTGVKLQVEELTLYTNKDPDHALLAAEIQPGNATNQTVVWSSSAPDIAAVDSSGRVRAVSPGFAFITVTTVDSGKTAACAVMVKEEPPVSVPVAGVTLNQTALTLYTDQNPGSATLTAAIQPENATEQKVIWNSSKPNVATVDHQGKVTAISPGSSVITVTTVDGGRKASCAVTVKKGGASDDSGNGGGNGSGDNGNGGGNGSGDSGNEASGSDSTSEDSPSYIHRILTDQVTGVTVAGNQINEYAALTVKPEVLHSTGDAGCDILRAAQGAGRVLSLYDISLSHGFYGNVTVSIPVEGRDGQTMTLVRCVGGNLTLSNVTADRGMVTVTVDSLSPFVLLNDVYTFEALAAPQVPAPTALVPDSDRTRNHRVKKGDTLSALAQRYGCTVAEIVAANPIIQNPDFILPGWLLEIP